MGRIFADQLIIQYQLYNAAVAKEKEAKLDEG
jgi:hypothetical protein